jgi:hypothetical protein
MFFDYGPAALLGSDTRLYDLAVDPGRNSPLKDSAPEAPMTRLMVANEVPPAASAAVKFASVTPWRSRAGDETSQAGSGVATTGAASHSASVQARCRIFRSGTIFARVRVCSGSNRAPARRQTAWSRSCNPAPIRRYEWSVCFNSVR